MMRRSLARGAKRRGVAAVELAFLLPILAFMFVATIDFARVFYYELAVDECARDGALYGRTTTADADYSYTTPQAAALAAANAIGLTPAPTVVVGYDSSPNGSYNQTTPPTSGPAYIQVTVTWTFNTLVNYPGIPSQKTLTGVAKMSVPPVTN